MHMSYIQTPILIIVKWSVFFGHACEGVVILGCSSKVNRLCISSHSGGIMHKEVKGIQGTCKSVVEIWCIGRCQW